MGSAMCQHFMISKSGSGITSLYLAGLAQVGLIRGFVRGAKTRLFAHVPKTCHAVTSEGVHALAVRREHDVGRRVSCESLHARAQGHINTGRASVNGHGVRVRVCVCVYLYMSAGSIAGVCLI